MLLLVALTCFAPGYASCVPRTYTKRTFPLPSVSYLPSVAGDWKWGLALTTLVYPLIVYAFVAASDRLHEWAAVSGGSGDYAVVVRRLGDGFLT